MGLARDGVACRSLCSGHKSFVRGGACWSRRPVGVRAQSAPSSEALVAEPAVSEPSTSEPDSALRCDSNGGRLCCCERGSSCFLALAHPGALTGPASRRFTFCVLMARAARASSSQVSCNERDRGSMLREESHTHGILLAAQGRASCTSHTLAHSNTCSYGGIDPRGECVQVAQSVGTGAD